MRVNEWGRAMRVEGGEIRAQGVRHRPTITLAISRHVPSFDRIDGVTRSTNGSKMTPGDFMFARFAARRPVEKQRRSETMKMQRVHVAGFHFA